MRRISMSLLSAEAAVQRPLAPSSQARLGCTVFSALAEIEKLIPAWQALLDRSVGNEPVLSPLWMLPWWRIFGAQGGRRLCIAGFYSGATLVGLAPLVRRRYWYRPGIPFRRLEPLGTGERQAEAIHPDYLGLLAERGREAEVAGALVESLAGGAFGAWDEFLLPMMNGDLPLPGLLADALRTAGLACHTDVTGSASYIPLATSWEGYLEALSGSRRAYIRQTLRRFESWAGTEARFHCVTGAGDLDEGQRVLAALHQERWGAEGKFGAPRFAAFHAAVLPALLEAGALELLWLSVQGEPIAAIYNILWNGKVYFYQSGRKTEVPSGQRPGIVLHVHAIRRAIEAGRREYDFLSGGEHYKKQLALATRPLVQLRATRRGLVEPARVLAEKGIAVARAVRAGARRWLGHSKAPGAESEM
jgi:CelD/BcsL family acetyltransferase involved in cellulose biosynthesis